MPTVTFCTLLDQHLVVGSYDQVRLLFSFPFLVETEKKNLTIVNFPFQVLVAAANPPTKYFSFFLTSLLETVRINIGECAAAAYTTLTLAAATKILMFDNQEVRLYMTTCLFAFVSLHVIRFIIFTPLPNVVYLPVGDG